MKLTTFVGLLTINSVVSGGPLQHEILDKRQGLAGALIDAAAKAIGIYQLKLALLKCLSDLLA